MSFEESVSEQRDIAALVVPQVGRVVAGPGPAYLLLDDRGGEVAETSSYLRHLTAGDFAVSSVRSYAMALLRWMRFLWAVDVRWQRADRVDVRDFVLWMRTARPGRVHRAGGPTPGGVNSRTGKRNLGSQFAAATINHNLAVVSGFYDYHLEAGAGALLNPVPARGSGGVRWNAHHNPLEPFTPGRRAAYRQRVAQLEPRAIPDELFDELFTAMPSVRDRALLAFYVSTGARPSELLGLLGVHVDYGEQLVAVVRKGTRAVQWLPASPEAFVWLRLYQLDLPAELVAPDQPVWWTLRRPWRRLDYDAIRAVIRRANATLGTNWTLHDLRHTFAVRMANDPKVPLVSLQVLLGHASVTTTQQYLRPHLDQVLAHARQHHERLTTSGGPQREPEEPGAVLGYDAEDLQTLFGWQKPGQVDQ